MANSKKNTSKTARVMNLLSKSREDGAVEQVETVTEPAVVESAAPVAAPAPAAPAAPTAPAHNGATTPLLSSIQADSAISHQVMSALENALDEELKADPSEVPAPVAETETVVEEIIEEPAEEAAAQEAIAEEAAQPVEEPVEVTVAEPVEEPTAVPVEEPTAPAQAEAYSSAEPTPPTQFKVDSQTTYVNVMESLVEDKATKYIDMFGLCKCPRCVADVKAYALNHLTPKYVVMHTGDVIPRITVYETQFSASVTAQILNACKLVMTSPRHEQK